MYLKVFRNYKLIRYKVKDEQFEQILLNSLKNTSLCSLFHLNKEAVFDKHQNTFFFLKMVKRLRVYGCTFSLCEMYNNVS